MWKNLGRTSLDIKTKKNIEKQIEEKPKALASSRPPAGIDFILPGGIGGGFDGLGPDIGEITYFTVLRVLSEAVGKLPIHVRDKEHRIVQNRAEYLLNIKPNDSMTPVSLLSYTEYARNHYGNGYIYVKYNEATGEIQSLTALDPRQVRLWIDDVNGDILQKVYYSYTTIAGGSYFLPAEDIIHVKNWHVDDRTRLIGLPVRETLHEYMTAAKSGQETQNSLYKNGMISSAVLNYVGDLSEEKKLALMDRLKSIGSKNKIIPLPKDWEVKPLNLSLSDNQYLETRKFTAAQIAAAFGVSPNQLNDYSRGSYSNATAQQLSFLTDTLLYISRQYEDELTAKLLTEAEIKEGKRIDIDTEAVLQSTPDVLSNILVKLVTGSVMTINEARDRAGLPPMPNADKLMTMPGSKTVEQKEEVVV